MNMYTDILEFCAEQGITLDADQIASAQQVFNEDAGVEDAAEKVIEKSADDPRSDDESQEDKVIDASTDDDEAGDVDPTDIEGEIDDAADDDFQNYADDQTKVEESAMFYSTLYDFCQENGVELTDSALQEMASAGIFDTNDDQSAYRSMLEYCVTNGVNLDANQIAALQEKFQ